MKRLVLITAAALLLSACSDEPGTRRHLADHGYTNIKTTGYEWFGCSKGDGWATGFTALSPAGKTVTGVVCSGWLKGATIRFF